MNPLSTALRGAACLLLAATPSLADDFYVSSSTGNNANDGLTPGTAWSSITFALASMPLLSTTGSHTIHVAAGTYSVGTGETFPLQLEGILGSGAVDVEIVSDAGSAATTIVGTGNSVFFIRSWREFGNGNFFRSRIARIEGFRIQALQNGIVVSASGGNLSTLMKDLILEGGSGTGISMGSIGDSFVGTSGDIDDLPVVDCEISGFGVGGIAMSSFGDLLIFTSCTATLTNTYVHDNAGWGLYVEGFDSSTTADLVGCRIEDNGAWGVELLQDGSEGLGFATLNGVSTLVAGNTSGGLRMRSLDFFSFSGPNLNLERCTVADNSGAGITSSTDEAFLDAETCILFGNTTDVAGQYQNRTIEFSDVGSGNTGGSATNISAIPLFVNSAAGDYRLQDVSPCIDGGNPALSPDPDGTVADMGAFPFDQDATQAYCVGKTNSLGCVPFVTWTGFASTSAPQAFALTANDVLPNEAGILVYGFQAGNLNFHGGKLCVKAPLQRYLPVKTAKSNGPPPCSGTLTRNFNSRIQSGVDAMLTAGQTTYVQWRLRDAADPAGFGDSLSNGASFLIAP